MVYRNGLSDTEWLGTQLRQHPDLVAYLNNLENCMNIVNDLKIIQKLSKYRNYAEL